MKIGIVGPLDSSKKIAGIMEQYFPQIVAIIYEVSKTEEAYLKIDESEKECDGLIFTGMGVYYKTIEKKDISLPHVYLPFSSSSIMKALWELKERFPDCKNISIDTVNRNEVEDTLEELNINDINIEFMEYNHLYEEKRYIDFHIKAQENKDTCISIIGLGWVYDQVKSQGYPTIRLYSTKSIIKSTIGKLLYKINEVIVKHSNLAVQVIYTKDQENISQYKKLEISSLIESNLIGYLKEIQGSIFSSKWNRFLIFSTRGAVENTQNLISLKNTLSFLKTKDIEIFVGTGLGMTAYESEVSANKALNAAINYASASIFKVENDKIEGPLLDKGELSYNFIMDKDEIDEMAKMIDLNPLYIQKINSIKEKYNKDTFTSDELANYLNVSTRTANRIINKILDHNCGEMIGLETSKSVGRPKKIIKIKFNIN
ncbi:MAG: hypothetical protein ACTHW2_02095 [Tissierella sp.]|uniref:hypothetical protein n=1 Tax=Tissierella sp. TaxID=41274 RepID=UPI003F9BBE28